MLSLAGSPLKAEGNLINEPLIPRLRSRFLRKKSLERKGKREAKGQRGDKRKRDKNQET